MQLGRIEKFIPYVAGLLAINTVYSKKAAGWKQLQTDITNLPNTLEAKLKADYMKLVYAAIIFFVAIPYSKKLMTKMPPTIKMLITGVLIYYGALQVALFIDPPEYGSQGNPNVWSGPTNAIVKTYTPPAGVINNIYGG